MSRTSCVGVHARAAASSSAAVHPRVRDAEGVAGAMSWKLLCAACSQRALPICSLRREEVRGRRLVRAHLLRGDDQVEVDGEVAARRGEQIVVDVREDAEAVAGGAQALERGVRVGERLPRRERVGEERAALVGERPAEGVGDAGGGLGEDVAIEAVALALDHRLDLRVRAQHLVAAELDAVLARGAQERVGDAALPVDERSVAVEGDDVVIGGPWRERYHKMRTGPVLHVDTLWNVRQRKLSSTPTCTKHARNLRTAERFLLAPPLAATFGAAPVAVCDISAKGARFRHDAPLETGTKSLLQDRQSTAPRR